MHASLRSLAAVVVLPLSILALGGGAACSDDPEPAAPVETPDAAAEAASGGLGFKPSNLDGVALDFNDDQDVVITDGECLFDTVNGIVGCASGGDAKFVAVPKGSAPGAVALGVFTMRSFKVEAGATVRVQGDAALVLVARTTMEIKGTISVEGRMSSPVSGGFTSVDVNAKGAGPGGGGAGSATTSAGGGAFCGAGGGGVAAPGGATYGSQELIPLLPGSSGGQGHVSQAGAGGGAVELVAGQSLTVVAGGVVNACGGGGAPGGLPQDQNASGGGSGGAILLESPTVEVAGTLAANGGGGGQGPVFTYGEDGKPTSQPASGGKAESGQGAGGNGSAGAALEGTIGVVSSTGSGGGGGGGAGRIRINTGPGSQVRIVAGTGIISPAFGSACATQGTIAR